MRANYLHLHDSIEALFADDVPGDLAEFGVWHGTTFLPMAEQARRHGRVIHAVDSFRGMDEPTEKDGGEYPKGSLHVHGSNVFRHLVKPYGDTVQIHEGWIPEVLVEMDGARFAFVHLDLDHYRPTLDVLRWLWPRMNPGGILVCHDWLPWRTPHILATAAIAEWFVEAGVMPFNENTESRHIWIRR